MLFSRNCDLASEMCDQIFGDKNQTIPVFLSDTSIQVNKLLLHILSEYKLEDKTDALFLPDLTQQEISCLLAAVLQKKRLESSLEVHRFWLDSNKYSKLENLRENRKHKRLKSRGDLGRSKQNVQHTSVKPVLLQHKDLQQKSRKLDKTQVNTTMKIIQKNLDLELNIENCDTDTLLETDVSDFIDGVESVNAEDIVKSQTYFVQENLLNFNADFNNEDVDPLGSVLLDQDEPLFGDTVDLTDLKVIIAGHDIQTENQSSDKKEATISPSSKADSISSPSVINTAVSPTISNKVAKPNNLTDLPPSLTVKQKRPEELSRVVQICDICDKQFSDRSSLKRHVKSIHSTEKNYRCDICLKSFSLQSYLTHHMQTRHSEPRTWICDFCGTKLRSKKGMQTHLLIHQEGTKNIPCEVCSVKFRHKSTLVKHINRVHSPTVSSLACDQCDKSFTHNEGLKRHKQKLHGSLRPYVCKDCSKTFAFQYELNRHKKLKSCARKRAVVPRNLPPVNAHVVLTEDLLDY